MIWLASRSPRRRDLLTWAGFEVEAHPSDVDETFSGGDPVGHAAELARRKAASAPADRVVVAADSVVHRDHHLFDMPRDRDEARAHLRALQGGWHRVTTGVCVRFEAETVLTVTTEVRFRALSEDEIAAYVATGEADDKAGAYGIQGRGGALVAEVRGSYSNVIGLPVEETVAALAVLGVHPRFS